MIKLLLLLAAGFVGLYYAEVYGYITPGGIIPDLTSLEFRLPAWDSGRFHSNF